MEFLIGCIADALEEQGLVDDRLCVVARNMGFVAQAAADRHGNSTPVEWVDETDVDGIKIFAKYLLAASTAHLVYCFTSRTPDGRVFGDDTGEAVTVSYIDTTMAEANSIYRLAKDHCEAYCRDCGLTLTRRPIITHSDPFGHMNDVKVRHRIQFYARAEV